MYDLIVYYFSPVRDYFTAEDATIADEGLQYLGLRSALVAFEQGGMFIVPHLLWHGTSVYPVSSEGLLVQSPLTPRRIELLRAYCNPDPHGPIKLEDSLSIVKYSSLCYQRFEINPTYQMVITSAGLNLIELLLILAW